MEKFVQKHLELLKLERDAEIDQTRILQEASSNDELQKRGLCIIRLRVASCCTGLHGRTVVTFESFPHSSHALPSHVITNGDIVGISLTGRPISDILASGVVMKVTLSSINVTLDETAEIIIDWDDDHPYNLVKLTNDVTYRRLQSSLKNLYKSSSSLTSILFGEEDPDFSSESASNPDGFMKEFSCKFLNEPQKNAVQFALKRKDVTIIHGPPGTGKTTTIVEIIIQAVLNGQKVLACAPSNVAVDNLIEKLAKYDCKRIIRLGHPARAMTKLQKYCLDAILSSSHEAEIIRSVRKDIDSNLIKLRKTRKSYERRTVQCELKLLKKELHKREVKMLKQILAKADVILCTLTSASSDGPLKHLSADHFDFVVIDECSQAIEAACWIAIPYANKCILAGDHLQLPPTVLSSRAAKEGMELSMMERLLELFKEDADKIMAMLTIQYRMNVKIMNWSSKTLYGNQLIADPSVENHLLSGLPGITSNKDTCIPLLLIDTAGCDFHELDLVEEISKANEGEADLVAIHVENLISSGVDPSCIGIISPYNLQVEFLRLRLQDRYANLEIKSVDSFQGREKEAIVISLVRSNNSGEVGFLAEHRRINVAITRAKRHLTVVCDSETVSKNEFMESLISYINDSGEVRSASMYSDDLSKLEMVRPVDLKFKDRINGSKVTAKSTKKQQNNKVDRKIHDEKSQFEAVNNEEREEAIRSKFEVIIRDFIDGDEHICELSTDLTSYERMIIHEICEQKKLNHVSSGEGADRRIIISKVGVVTESESENQLLRCSRTSNISSAEEKNDRNNRERSVDRKGDKEDGSPRMCSKRDESATNETLSKSSEMRCKVCGTIVPSHNFELHKLRCRKSETKKKISVQKSSVKSVKKRLSDNNDDDDDLDGLIAAISKVDKTCALCKRALSLLAQKCEHCNRQFCLSHVMPEIHGCGTSAKAKARQQMRRDMATAMNTNSQLNKSKAPRASIERRLDKKLKQMADSRCNKKK